MVTKFGGQILATKFGFVPDCWKACQHSGFICLLPITCQGIINPAHHQIALQHGSFRYPVIIQAAGYRQQFTFEKLVKPSWFKIDCHQAGARSSVVSILLFVEALVMCVHKILYIPLLENCNTQRTHHVIRTSLLCQKDNITLFSHNDNIITFCAPVLEFRFYLNSLHAKFFRGNINIYLQFMSLLPIDVTQVLKILPHVRPGPTYST